MRELLEPSYAECWEHRQEIMAEGQLPPVNWPSDPTDNLQY